MISNLHCCPSLYYKLSIESESSKKQAQTHSEFRSCRYTTADEQYRMVSKRIVLVKRLVSCDMVYSSDATFLHFNTATDADDMSPSRILSNTERETTKGNIC